MNDKFLVPISDVEKVREWFRQRGGVLRWSNCEIGASRPDIITPALTDEGKPYPAPHWAYMGSGKQITPADLTVTDRQSVDLPLEWFPVCKYCNGSGIRSVAQIAKARGITLAECHKQLAETPPLPQGYTPGSPILSCWCCQGTGRVDREIRVAIRKRYWGYDISQTGKQRAGVLARKLGKIAGQPVKWDWQHVGYGLAALTFYTESLAPFTLER